MLLISYHFILLFIASVACILFPWFASLDISFSILSTEDRSHNYIDTRPGDKTSDDDIDPWFKFFFHSSLVFVVQTDLRRYPKETNQLLISIFDTRQSRVYI